MKFQVICRNDGDVEIHSRTCKEVDWTNYYSDGIVDAVNPFGAAVETCGGDELAALEALYFPCLAPGYEAPENRPRRGRRPTRRAVPFDVEESTDEEVIAACMGKRITWTSEISGREDSGVLYPPGPHEKLINGRMVTSFPHNHTTITNGAAGRRVLNFIHRGDRETGTQFRAVALESIVSVR